MHQQIFVNLPVKDLQRSIEFFTSLDYTFNPQFTDENATCMILGDNLFAMLLVEDYFTSFHTSRKVADTSVYSECYVALAVDRREKVDTLVDAALAAGATTDQETQDLGFMYQRSYADLDGHIWEITWMNPDASFEA